MPDQELAMPKHDVARSSTRFGWFALTLCVAACSSPSGANSGSGTGNHGGSSGSASPTTSGQISSTSGSSGAIGAAAGAAANAGAGTSAGTTEGASAGADTAAGAGTGADSGAGGSADAGASADAAPSDSSGSPATSESGTAGITLPSTLVGNVKIMVLGSSNELGSCWRAYLWQKLHAAGITNFDFVGSIKADPGCGVPDYDTNLEAHDGWIIEDLSVNDWVTIFKANPPDIVLEHNGGADLLAGHPYANVIKAYTLGVTAARMVNPRVIYLAAQHTPQMPDNADVMMLNAAMVPWAAGITTAESPVALVDLFTGINMQTDMSDGVHLNDMGSEIVSDRWFAALAPILKP
jgi:hypothetical protein